MSAPKFPYRSTISGRIGHYTEEAASVFAETLERVTDDDKPFEPGLFDAGTVSERAARRSGPDVIDVTTIAETPTTTVEESESDDKAPAESTPQKKGK